MVLAALLLIATIISTWFCCWFLRTFDHVLNRASRIATLVCPALLALIFAVGAGTLLGQSGLDIDFSAPTWHGRAIGALILGFAVFITAPALTIAWIVGSWFANRREKASSQ